MKDINLEQVRQKQCQMRLNGTCCDINVKIGWRHGIPLEECDKCFEMGPRSEEAEAYRKKLAREHVEFWLWPDNLARVASRETVESILQHAEPAKRAELRKLVLSDNSPSAKLDRWNAVKTSWGRAQSFTKSVASKGIVGKRVSLSIRGERDVSCFGGVYSDGTTQLPCDSLIIGKDGKTKFCGECGCGEKEAARLTVPEGEYSKLDYPYLECPRRKRGFSNFDDTPFEVDLKSVFDGVFVINLDRRADRLKEFEDGLGEVGWPFEKPERFSATDGHLLPVPYDWKAGGGAWGCMQSHRRVLERAIERGLKSILVIEDDAVCVSGFKEKVAEFLTAVPEDWDCLMIGGQHIEEEVAVPERVNDHVVKTKNCQRTHCYALRGPAIAALYREWCSKSGHCDHIMGPFMARFNTYAPTKFLVGQRESKSDINGKVNSQRTWNKPDGSRLVFLLMTENAEVKEALCGPGGQLHVGNEIDPKTGMERKLEKVLEGGKVDRGAFKGNWLPRIEWEAEQVGRAACVWIPGLVDPEPFRAILGDRLQVIQTDSVEEALKVVEDA